MNDQQFDHVVDYVITQLNSGVGEETLYQQLTTNGYPKEYIERVFAEIHTPVSHQEEAPPQESLTAGAIDAAARVTSKASRMQGRLGRRGFLFTLLTTYVLLFVPIAIILIAFGFLHQYISKPVFTAAMLVMVPIMFGVIVWTIWLRFTLCVRRLHDMDQPGCWALLSFLRLLDFVLYVVLSIVPGNSRDNEYGSYDPEMNPLRVLRLTK